MNLRLKVNTLVSSLFSFLLSFRLTFPKHKASLGIPSVTAQPKYVIGTEIYELRALLLLF